MFTIYLLGVSVTNIYLVNLEFKYDWGLSHESWWYWVSMGPHESVYHVVFSSNIRKDIINYSI